MVPANFFMTFSRSRSMSNALHYLFSPLISLHIETKMPCFKRVNASSFLANCLSMKEIRKTIRKKMVLESFSEHFTGICSTFST